MSKSKNKMKENRIPKASYLQDIISKTRKARINAECRLLELDALLKHATLFYSCITVALTLVQLFYVDEGSNASRTLSFLSVVSAIIITICTTYASSQNYAVRAEQMKTCYLELQRLSLQLDDVDQEAESCGTSLRIDSIGEKYVDVLARTENHLQTDYYGAGAFCFSINGKSLNYFVLRFLVYVLPILLGAGFCCLTL